MPFSCVGIIFVGADWSGHNAFLTYMIKVLEDTGFTKSQAKIGPIIAGSIRLFLSGSNKPKYLPHLDLGPNRLFN